MTAQDAQDDLPALTPLAFDILLALAGDALHGYAIMQDIAARSGAASRPHAGTLYRAIARLVEGGLVEELDERPAADEDDERRRYYRMTAAGRRVAAAEAARLAAKVREAASRRLLEPGVS